MAKTAKSKKARAEEVTVKAQYSMVDASGVSIGGEPFTCVLRSSGKPPHEAFRKGAFAFAENFGLEKVIVTSYTINEGETVPCSLEFSIEDEVINGLENYLKTAV